MVVGGHMLRLTLYTELSFHPIETNAMLDPGSFYLLPQIPLFSPIQPWWLLSHHCLHPPLVAQWTPVCRPVSQTDFYLLRSPQLVESLLLPISEVAEWLLPLICTLPFFSDTRYFSLTLFRCDKSNPVSLLLNSIFIQASKTSCWASLSKSVMNRSTVTYMHCMTSHLVVKNF